MIKSGLQEIKLLKIKTHIPIAEIGQSGTKLLYRIKAEKQSDYQQMNLVLASGVYLIVLSWRM